MTTIEDIINRVNVTTKQVEMSIYSGMIPKPNLHSEWDESHIEPFLLWWEEKLERTKPKENNGNYQCGKLTIPRHTR
jgi:hypothetical protein